MKRPSPLPGIQIRKAFGFVNLYRLFGARAPESDVPTPEPAAEARRPADIHDLQPLLRALARHPDEQAPMTAEDWDMMFRAIQLRLVQAVGDRLDSAPAPAADDAAGHVQVAVLECVTAMAQLHAALKRQRG